MHSLTLQTGEATVVDGDILGRLGFAASNEADGMLDVTAKLEAVAEKTFDADENATEFVFSLAADGTVASKMTLSSAGLLTVVDDIIIKSGGTIGGANDTDLLTLGNGALTVAGTLECSTSLTIGSAVMSEADLEFLDGITAGTAAASKAVVLDGSKNIATIGTIGCGAITSTGSSSFATSVKTSLIEYTAGDDSMTIADGGKVTFAAGFAVGSDAAGDILYHNGTSYVRLPKGSADQVLTMNDGETAPGWENAAGGSARSVAGDTDNGIVTWVTSDNTFAVESNLSYTGGDLLVGGSTPSVTIGDAGTEDTKLVFDGNAQDFYVGLDDTDDDLKIGLGSAVGTTPVITMTGAGAVNFGVDDTGYDVTMYGATAGSYLRWDESLDRLNIFGGSFRIEQVPASNSGTTVSDDSGATINIDWERGNYHWVVLDANVTKIVFQNMKRGGRYILRIEQHSSSPKTVSWGNVDDASSDFTEVRWVGGTAPTMTATAGRVDVYGFLCTRSNGRGMDGFVIAQNLTEDGTH